MVLCYKALPVTAPIRLVRRLLMWFTGQEWDTPQLFERLSEVKQKADRSQFKARKRLQSCLRGFQRSSRRQIEANSKQERGSRSQRVTSSDPHQATKQQLWQQQQAALQQQAAK